MQQFIDKLISRLEEEKQQIDANEGFIELGIKWGYKQAIEIVNQIAEEYKGGWIPCSERLPENISTVILQVKEIEKPTIGWYGNVEGWRLKERDFVDLREFTVLAWMPLPSPYQKEGE